MYDDFFLKAHELQQTGVPFVTATVVRAERPTSGKPGDKAIIAADGTMYGWIGGSCAQPTVVREALRSLADDESRLIRLSPNPAAQAPRPGLLDVAMTCFSGGTLEIFIEPRQPRPQLLIVGSLPVARSLAELGRAMNYRVIVADPDHAGPPPAADLLLDDLRRIPEHAGQATYAVVATHGQYDEPALEQILSTPAAYVGLVSSRRRAEEVRNYLAGQGVAPEALARLRAPAGLAIGARRGDEIALSIMAEIVQLRRGVVPGTAQESIPLAASPPVLAIAIDPVCRMEMAIAGAKHTYVHEGTTYYFCCPGCRYSFKQNPAEYLHPANGTDH